MKPERPWPFGTIITPNEAFLTSNVYKSLLEKHRRRRLMVIKDNGGNGHYAVQAIAIVTEYDDADDTHYPAPAYWEPVDEV